MVAQSAASYADRAKTTRTPTASKPPSNSHNSLSSSIQAEASQNSPSNLSSGPPEDSTKPQTPSTSGVAVNGINSTAAPAPGATGTLNKPPVLSGPSSSTPAGVNGHPTPSPVQSAPPQNVWAARKEQLKANRASSVSQQQPASVPPPNSNTPRQQPAPQSSTHTLPSAVATTTATSSGDSTRNHTESHAIPNSSGPTSRPPKKKTASSSTGNVSISNASTTTSTAPDFAAAAEWPAPIEAAVVSGSSTASNAPSTSRKDNAGEEDAQGRAHSRESSSTGQTGHGKKSKKTRYHHPCAIASAFRFLPFLLW